MTVKKGDIVFVTQAHHAQQVAAIVMGVVPATRSGLPQASVHIVSSADPYSTTLAAHREYADDVGYLEVDEEEPFKLRPKEINNADAPQEFSEGFAEESDSEGDGAGVVSEEPRTPEESEAGGEGQPEEESEEVIDEREEDESPAEVPEEESDGEPVPPAKHKRHHRSKGKG